ncbi:hypothetical protein [Levilactobacillus acidifarinae]|uniref:Uncharacterized protein n=1 Tax=Levilactobacillus acidifarinae DSM 19394 = JCM 15949 TaxID=1423715 RepID=A0A0R1LJM2_9LACO|nr:hypothetical protein [Levilactobacillus acidifarinae]KRK96156.1 hypothetical protein FD25_GL002622 [Levilactobacillus acidifarinae DSM 19394]GEO69517.1 hypothetical protein LAC03_14270 [Levilactobacillus acidifarinae]
MKWWQARQQAFATQLNDRELRLVRYILMGLVIASVGLAALHRTELSSGAVGVWMLMVGDYWAVRLAQRRVNFLVSLLLGYLGALVGGLGLLLGLGLIFRW